MEESKSSNRITIDMSPWLNQLNSELTGALADMANTLGNIEDGTYSQRAGNQKLGVIQWMPDPNSGFALRATNRAAETCFRAAIDSFISFLDKLIGVRRLTDEGVVCDRDLSSAEDVIGYLNARLNEKIALVSRDASLTNPMKLSSFSGLSGFSKKATLGYFALRRCLVHHQGIPADDIQICVRHIKVFADETEITELPFLCKAGQAVRVQSVPHEKTLHRGIKVSLKPEEAHSIVLTLQVVIAPEILELSKTK